MTFVFISGIEFEVCDEGDVKHRSWKVYSASVCLRYPGLAVRDPA